ncbi:MAG: hypothetical protein OXC80_12975 [Gammaproteobacteria bacterium]|nr:hypothetical protein [Gammaproteobacteria bacterium]
MKFDEGDEVNNDASDTEYEPGTKMPGGDDGLVQPSRHILILIVVLQHRSGGAIHSFVVSDSGSEVVAGFC